MEFKLHSDIQLAKEPMSDSESDISQDPTPTPVQGKLITRFNSKKQAFKNWTNNNQQQTEEKKKKIFFLPTRKEETFIDSGSILDLEGYPILPNGETIYVKPSGINILNFGNVGFTKRVTTEFRSKGVWKVKRIFCLGALCCDLPECNWAGPPPTGRIDINEYLKKNPNCRGSAGKCTGKVSHIPCKDTITRVDEHVPTNWAILRHRGVHNHLWPEAKKPDLLSKQTLMNEIVNNPKTRPLALKTSKPSDQPSKKTSMDEIVNNTKTRPLALKTAKSPDQLSKQTSMDEIVKSPETRQLALKTSEPNSPQEPIDSVLDIHSSFSNVDRFRYYRNSLLKEMNYPTDNNAVDDGYEFLREMSKWTERGLHIISQSFQQGSEHFTFQSEWMGKYLTRRDTNRGKVKKERSMITDVNEEFFENGYLLTTSIYSEELNRWVPIQATWIRDLSENYYQIHYSIIFRKFINNNPSTTTDQSDSDSDQSEDYLFLYNFVVFSWAQRNGFIQAYMQVFGDCDPSIPISKLKGCHHHYRAQMKRVKKNCSIVKAAADESVFERMCMELAMEPQPGDPSHQDRMRELHRRFPKARRWLDWWIMADADGMLFPARRPLLEDKPAKTGRRRPATSQVQGNSRRPYYMISGKKKTILEGMIEILCFVKGMEQDYNAVMRGISIEYGSQRGFRDDTEEEEEEEEEDIISKSVCSGLDKKRKKISTSIRSKASFSGSGCPVKKRKLES